MGLQDWIFVTHSHFIRPLWGLATL